MPPKKDPVADATLEVATATQQAVEAQTKTLEEQNNLLKEVCDSMKTLVAVMSGQKENQPASDDQDQGAVGGIPAPIQPPPLPTRVTAVNTSADTQAPQPAAPVSTVAQIHGNNGHSNTLPPMFQQPAVDLMVFSPSGRQSAMIHTPSSAQNGVPVMQNGVTTVQNGISPVQNGSILQVSNGVATSANGVQSFSGVPSTQHMSYEAQKSRYLFQQAPRNDVGQFMDYYAKTQEQLIPQMQGEVTKGNSCQISHVYMFIERYDIRESDYNKKFQIRFSITFDEYIHAYMKMLLSPNPPFPVVGAFRHHLNHIMEMSRQVKSKPWEYVRFWSLSLFDMLESGTISLEDQYKVDSERYRLFELAETLIAQNAHVCKAYQVGSCDKQNLDIKSHIVEMSTQKHICAYCHKNDKVELSHPEFRCRNKKGIKKGNAYNNNQNIPNYQPQQQFPYQQNNNFHRGQNSQSFRFSNPNNHNQQPFIQPVESQRFQFNSAQQQLNPQAQSYQSKN